MGNCINKVIFKLLFLREQPPIHRNTIEFIVLFKKGIEELKQIQQIPRIMSFYM